MRSAFVGLPLLALSAILLAPAPGLAAAKGKKTVDTLPPVITHVPIPEAPAGAALPVSATIIDDSEVFEPTLYYRQSGTRKYMTHSMLKAGVIYSATIPEAVMQADVEYFIEAYDANGNGPSLFGSNNAPHRVKVAQVVVPLPPPPPPAEEVKPPAPTDLKVIDFKPAETPPAPEDRLVVTGPMVTDKPAPPPSPGRGIKIGGFSMLGVGATAVGAGIYFGLQANDQGRKAQGEPEAAKAKLLASNAQSNATLANVSFVAGGALAVGGLVLALMPTPARSPEPTPELESPTRPADLETSFFIAPGGAGFALIW